MNGPNKLECYITLGWTGLPGTNTLAYWAHLTPMLFSDKSTDIDIPLDLVSMQSHFFSSSLWVGNNKLDRLSLANF